MLLGRLGQWSRAGGLSSRRLGSGGHQARQCRSVSLPQLPPLGCFSGRAFQRLRRRLQWERSKLKRLLKRLQIKARLF
uniref:Uncharacterized protein n=1 Tax=Arundo donax TaxID=35708 RepID=A0A0A9FV06_ARUDO